MDCRLFKTRTSSHLRSVGGATTGLGGELYSKALGWPLIWYRSVDIGIWVKVGAQLNTSP